MNDKKIIGYDKYDYTAYIPMPDGKVIKMNTTIAVNDNASLDDIHTYTDQLVSEELHNKYGLDKDIQLQFLSSLKKRGNYNDKDN